jgi:hypothetical protein
MKRTKQSKAPRSTTALAAKMRQTTPMRHRAARRAAEQDQRARRGEDGGWS